MSRLTYRHTIAASYLGYITQAIVNNLAPLLFVTFMSEFSLTLEQITLMTTVNFAVQLLVDLLSAKLVDRIGYRVSIVAAHVLAVLVHFQKGVEEGIFRNDINFAIINQAMSMQMEMLIYSDITENYPISEIYSEVTFLHMRGITTPKGMQMVDAFLQSVKEKP